MKIAAKRKRHSTKTNRAPKKAPNSKPTIPTEQSLSAEEVDEKAKRAAEHFTKGVLIRGEAAKPIDGKLPSGATHEIVEENDEGLPKIERRRYSAY